MDEIKDLSKTVWYMYFLNFCIILYYSIVCIVTKYRICSTFYAYEFLSTVQSTPMKPWDIMYYSFICFFILLYLSLRKNNWDQPKNISITLCCLGEILLCIGIIASMNFYYSGIALVVLADLINVFYKTKIRSLLMAVLILIFVIGRYEIIPFTWERISFSSYLSYYTSSAQILLSGVESVLVSTNTMMFVYYMVRLFTSQREENERIKNLYAQLKEANRKLKEYMLELERMTEVRERNRLAREIHDTLGHTLTGIIMGTEASLALMEKNPSEAKERLTSVTESARDGLNDVRQSIKALRPDALENHNLEQALKDMIAKYQKTTSVTILYEQQAGKLEFADDEEDTLYRIIQEGMTNAVRHGNANFIHIKLQRFDDILVIDIRDNGEGCDEVKEGFGLRHMQERLELLSGSLTYGNRKDDPADRQNGFYIIASLPVRNKEETENG